MDVVSALACLIKSLGDKTLMPSDWAEQPVEPKLMAANKDKNIFFILRFFLCFGNYDSYFIPFRVM